MLVKPGRKTSELWVVVGSIVLAAVLVWFGRHWMAGLLPIGGGMYAISRGLAKAASPFADWRELPEYLALDCMEKKLSHRKSSSSGAPVSVNL